MPDYRPSPEELREFIAGRLVGEAADEIVAYLASSPGALAELDELAQADEFSASFVGVAEDGLEPADDPNLAAVIGRLKAGDLSPLNLEEQARRVLDVPITADAPGRLGKFEILELIAAGGMGLVFRGRDPHLQRDVAIKTLSARLAADRESRGRFLREARAVADLDHANILPIHAVEEGIRVPFIVMPLAEQSLEGLVGREGRLPVARAVRLMIQAAEAIASAHAKGIVHRDIKPANLLLDAAGERVFVADFGIAQRLGRAGEEPGGLGTPAFAAPEQIAGEEASVQSDLYALGATLQFAVGGGAAERGQRAKLPKWLRQLIGALLQVEPGQRPDSAQAVATRLRAGLRKSPLRRALALSVLAVPLVAAAVAALTPLGISGWVNRALGWGNGEHLFVAGRFGTFGSLQSAIRASAGRAVIIDIDGEVELSTANYEGERLLEIRAAPGRRPVLVQGDSLVPMIDSKGPLSLEGLVFFRPGTVGARPALVRVINATLSLRRCAVIAPGAQGRTPIHVLGWNSGLVVSDCVIHSGAISWLNRRAMVDSEVAQTAPIEVTNSLIIGQGATVYAKPFFTLEADLQRVTAVGDWLFVMAGNSHLHVEAEGCWFAIARAMLWMRRLGDPASAPRFIAWMGERNAYAPGGLDDGFLRCSSRAGGGQSATPDQWSALDYADELEPETIAMGTIAAGTLTLPEVKQALAAWAGANRGALERPGARGADVRGLLRDCLDIDTAAGVSVGSQAVAWAFQPVPARAGKEARLALPTWRREGGS